MADQCAVVEQPGDNRFVSKVQHAHPQRETVEFVANIESTQTDDPRQRNVRRAEKRLWINRSRNSLQ